MNTILDLINGVGWSVVYIFAIVLGIREKTWCIPAIAICQNFSWEFWVILDRITAGGTHSIAFIIQLVWLILDIIILGIWLYCDRRKPYQSVKNIILLIMIFVAMYLLAYSAGKWEFTAFLINVIMSLAFVIRDRNDSNAPRSYTIAVCKLVGTLAATILNGIIFWNPLLLWLGGVCFLLDSYYLSMVLRHSVHSG